MTLNYCCGDAGIAVASILTTSYKINTSIAKQDLEERGKPAAEPNTPMYPEISIDLTECELPVAQGTFL